MMKDFQTPDFSAFTASIEKLVALNVSKFESAVEAQTAAAKELVELTEARAKALTEVKDMDGLNSFMEGQKKLAEEGLAKAVKEGQTAVEEAKSYAESVQQIITDSLKK